MKDTKQSTRMIAYVFGCLLLAGCATPAPTATPTPAPLLPTRASQPTSIPTPIPPLPTNTLRPTPAPTSTPPPPISPEFPIGTFFHSHSGGVFCVWQFNPDGTYAYFWLTPSVDVDGRTPYVAGTYRVEGNLYTETSATGTGSAFCEASSATYAWTFDGKALTFQAVGKDDCAERQRTYESPLKWTKAD